MTHTFKFYAISSTSPILEGDVLVLVSEGNEPCGSLRLPPESWDLLSGMLLYGSGFYQDSEARIEIVGNGETG